MNVLKITAAPAVLWLCLAIPLHAQEREIAFELVHLPGGYTGNSIEAIAQDHDGFMWFGSWAGLHRYDGYDVVTFVHEPSDSTSISKGGVLSLYVDRQGSLWVGTHTGGLDRYDPATETFTHYRHDPRDDRSLSNNTVSAILEDGHGLLWVGTHHGLNRLDRETGTFTRFTFDSGDRGSISDNTIRVIYEDREGTIWVGTGPVDKYDVHAGGLNRFDPSTSSFTRFKADPHDDSSLLNPNVNAILEDSRGTLWVGTGGDGLHTLNPRTGKFTRFPHDPNDPNRLSSPLVSERWSGPGVQFIHEDRSGMLWIGAFGGGITRYDPASGEVTHYRRDQHDPASLIENWVHRMYESRDGTLWVGVICGGVNKVVGAKNQFKTYPFEGFVTAVHEDRDGKLWLGIDGRGLWQYDRETGNATNYRRDWDDASTLVNNVVYSIHGSRDGSLWIGTADGLCRFDQNGKRFTCYRNRSDDPSSLSSSETTTVLEDRQGNVWVGTWLAGLNRFDPKTGLSKRYTSSGSDDGSLGSNLILALYEARDGGIWIGTGGGGLSQYDPATDGFVRYVHDPTDPSSLSENNVSSILETADGTLWVGTAGGGLNRLDQNSGRFTRYSGDRLDLTGSHINSILDDADGNLWIRTDDGLTVFDRRNGTFRKIWTDPSPLNRPYRYFSSFGAHHKGARGEQYFSSAGVLVAFSPGDIARVANHVRPQLVLTDFRLLGQQALHGRGKPLTQSIVETDDIVLRHDDNIFDISFAALHYADPSQNQYAYILEGYDEAWRDAGTRRTANYFRVPPGDYVFKVTAAQAFGYWTETAREMRIRILPPWWETWPFRFTVFVFLLAAIVVGTRAHVQGIRRRNSYLEEVVAERTAEVERHAARLLDMDAAKSRFFANISHEFRTPLTLILGPLQDAMDGVYGPVDERLAAQLGRMRRNAERLLRLISQLLDLSRLEFGSMTLHCRRVDVLPLIRDFVLAFASRAEREAISLQFSAPDDSIAAYVDPDKLEKIITNLLSNAFTFTPSHGKIRVSVERQEDDGHGVVDIVVRDTGHGIAHEHLPFIFDRFYRAAESSPRNADGTGIGLALVKELVELHGGTIRVESEPSFGTSFFIRIPLGSGHLKPNDIVDPSEHSPSCPELLGESAGDRESRRETDALASHLSDEPGARPRVLVIEDNADVRDYIRYYLSTRYQVVEAADGRKGLDLVRTAAPDLVICDVMIPEVDGYTVCREIKSDPQLCHTAVFLVTARASEDDKIEGLEAGADDYLYKPFTMHELLARVDNAIRVRRSLKSRFSGEVVVKPSGITATPADALFLERVRKTVEAHMVDPGFGAEQLAGEVGLSARHLTRRLVALTTLTTAEYIRSMRLDRAAQLLDQRAGTVSEVAYRVGFRNADHFSRVFRQTFGVTPSKYLPLNTSDAD